MTLALLCSTDPIVSILKIQNLAPSEQSGSQKRQCIVSISFLWKKLKINLESIIDSSKLKLKSLGIVKQFKENVLVRSGIAYLGLTKEMVEASCESMWIQKGQNLIKIYWKN